jgi:uncharacterized membrane protein
MLAILFYDVVKWIHVMAVVVAFGGAFTYPVWFRFLRPAAPAERAFFHRVQAFLGRWVISPGLLVILIAGVYMTSDRNYWSKPWVSVPLLILVVLGGLGGMFFGPKEQRLAELAAEGGGAEYERVLVQVRNVTYVAIALVTIAALMMVTKLGS